MKNQIKEIREAQLMSKAELASDRRSSWKWCGMSDVDQAQDYSCPWTSAYRPQ